MPFPRVGRPAGPPRLPFWAVAVIAACCLVEAALWIAPLLGFADARQIAMFLGAFWSPLFWGGAGIYPGQVAAMFLTYGLLHGGPLHLAMNMISLVAVGREVTRLMGPWRFAAVYAASQIGGALAFAWLQPQAGPMIGASGAVFGVAGALVVQAGLTLRRRQRSTRPLVRAVVLILGLNVALTVLMPSIAWEAHLGGAVTGIVLALVLGGRRV